MTMMSFRIDEAEAKRAQQWAERLGTDRSEIFRVAVRQYLDRLAGEEDARAWETNPLGDGERALESIADWGPAEDWSEWAHASG